MIHIKEVYYQPSNMIIGIDASRANTKERSGVEWYAFHLIHNLAKIDSKNQYFLYSNKEFRDDLKIDQPNFHLKVLKWPFSRLWTLGRLTLEMIFKKVDVLIVPSHTLPLVGARKNILSWHDLAYEHYPEVYTKSHLMSLKQGIKRGIKKADKIITISNFTRNEIVEKYNLSLDRIEVTYMGIDHKLWKKQDEKKVKNYLRENNFNLPYFVYLGRLTAKKNVPGLIEAYNIFRKQIARPHNLYLIGFKGFDFKLIEKAISSSPYSNEIKVLGYTPSKELPIIFAGAEALVFPSFYEGFGIPVIEAMASGCPVITSNLTALPEVVAGSGILVDPRNKEDIAKAMEKIVSDNNFKEELRLKGLSRAKEFTWLKCAKKTLEIIENI
ncbi:glycosyltransferase family 4 protein [bacterium]|nr:glycosyltransferase family 4 protein [bacterium]MBT5401402.1 glycosyltransferase family 4 protein [bacterium]